MARLRHFALNVRDPYKSAEFYKKVFGFEIVGEEVLDLGTGVFLSDGVVNLALLKLNGKTEEEWEKMIGSNHFGIQVDDIAEAEKAIEEAGGAFFFEFPGSGPGNAERKYKDPDGVVFDVSRYGWLGTDSRFEPEDE
ncbi:VOC family protein [Shimia sediminis]|uniref:VOC family protein n=1 Tax=Shimia sediminis TaxID=2497945 RepID=UPI0013DF4F93|nr:VOC family protein [Shimia sediminis]